MILLLNEITNDPDVPDSAHAYSFFLPPEKLLNLQNPIHDIIIPISGVKDGTYLARIQVDGAESPLDADGSGKYCSPWVLIQ